MSYQLKTIGKEININSSVNNLGLMEPAVSEKPKYHLSQYRYINLTVYLLVALVNSLPAQAFSSMNSLVENVFEISPVSVTLNTLLFPIMHPLAAFPSGWILDKLGMKIGCCIGGCAVILGVWLRTLLAVGNPYYCLLGSLLAAFGNVFVLNSSSLMAVNWFQSEIVPKIIMVCALINFLSAALGGSAAGWFLSASSQESEVISFLMGQALFISVVYVLFFILFRQKPEFPPSESAALSINTRNSENYKEGFKKLIQNRQYIKIALSSAFSFGSVISYFTILNQCLSTLGYQEPGSMTSTTISSMIVSSLISTVAYSQYVDKTRKYKFILSIVITGSILGIGSLNIFFLTQTESIVLLIIVGLFSGMFVFPLNSLLIAYASDVAFPAGQGSITGYLLAFSQTFGFISGMLFINLIDKQNVWKTYVIMICHVLFFVLALTFNLKTKQILKRTKYEQQKLLRDEERAQ